MNRCATIVLCLAGSCTLVACDRPDPPTEPLRPDAGASSPVTGRVRGDTATPVSADPPRPVLVAMRATAGHAANGHLSLSRSGEGVRILGALAGLPAGSEHGFHVHEVGDCSAPDASSAGAHFNPDAAPHGRPDGAAHHAGDLPNLRADANGNIAVDVVSQALALGTGDARDIAGRAIVLHAEPDDYRSQPAGASGDRIACGVIGAAPRA
jgi:Cu-Zn family superoxide dismutase